DPRAGGARCSCRAARSLSSVHCYFARIPLTLACLESRRASDSWHLAESDGRGASRTRQGAPHEDRAVMGPAFAQRHPAPTRFLPSTDPFSSPLGAPEEYPPTHHEKRSPWQGL